MHIPNFAEVLQEESAQPHVIKRLLSPSYVCINICRSSDSREVSPPGYDSQSLLYRISDSSITQWHS